MTDARYMFWSKSSVYLKAIRNQNLHCCISTFYKYCRLLGFKARQNKKKSNDYNPIRTFQPNELWCADVTIYKTINNVKYYIHFLMDHYSKMILGYRVEKSNSGQAIKNLLYEATLKYNPKKVQFLTDGGSENVNTTVAGFLNSLTYPIKHIIAQKDVAFSNSMIEALNKIIKHQFLYPKNIKTGTELITVLDKSIPIYNKIRPQWSLGGNTPFETFNSVSIDLSKYKTSFSQQKILRLAQNKENSCKICL